MTVESVTQAVSNLALQFGEEDADPGAMVTLSRVWWRGGQGGETRDTETWMIGHRYRIVDVMNSNK